MYLIVGLGNPGEEYFNTRHNMGFHVVEELSERLGISELRFKTKCRAMVAEAKIADHKLILAEPQTFMNLSGEAVRLLLNWYKIPLDHLIVVHDDVDIDPGEIRVKAGGSSAGHHGIESIVEHINEKQFTRVRVGVGRGKALNDVTEYVLKDVPKKDKAAVSLAISNAADAVMSIVTEGLAPAMNKFNGLKAS
jgi:PTH1 family peptidyl-tRNA hydrolase